MEKIFKKIEYMKKNKINLDATNVSDEARRVIENAKDNDSLALRLRINSPIYIEAAAPLTSEGIRQVCSANE